MNPQRANPYDPKRKYRYEPLVRVGDLDEARRRLAAIAGSVRPAAGGIRVVKRAGWLAARVPNRDVAVRIWRRMLGWCKRHSQSVLRAVAITDLERLAEADFALEPAALDVPATRVALDNYSVKIAESACRFNYALFPEDVSWILLSTLDRSYLFLLGPPGDLEELLGVPAEDLGRHDYYDSELEHDAQSEDDAHFESDPELDDWFLGGEPLPALEAFREHYARAGLGQPVFIPIRGYYEALRPVDELAELRRRYAVLRRAVELPGDETIRFIKRPGWVAVPGEDGVDQLEAENMAAYARRQGQDFLWALGLERGMFTIEGKPGISGWEPASFDVPLIPRVIENIDYPHFYNYALLPQDGAWVLVSSIHDEYRVLMGPPELVEEIMWCSVERGFARFEEYIAEVKERGEEKLAEAFLLTLTKLRDRYPELPAGEWVSDDLTAAEWSVALSS